MGMEYIKNYCEEKEISTSKLNEAQRTLYYMAENMKMDKSISEEGYKHFQMAIKALEEPHEDCVSRTAIRLKLAEMPKYHGAQNARSIRRLKDFLEKEYGEPLDNEVTPDTCIGFTLALELIQKFIWELPPVILTKQSEEKESKEEICR